MPGAGHNYLGILNETVNPANGSVSVKIATPAPPGRKLTVPFSFAYNSNGTIFVAPGDPSLFWGAPGASANGMWQYTVPTLSYSTVTFPFQGGPAQCEVAYNYVYTDASGTPHPLYLSIYGPYKAINIDCSTTTMPNGASIYLATNGGDTIVQGYTPEPSSSHSFTMQKVWVTDADGTVATFTPPQLQGGYTIVPDTIEDRNGNVVTINHTSPPTIFNSYTDTLGRTSVSISGTNPQTISVSGVTNYSASFGPTTVNNTNLTIDQYSGSCPVKSFNPISVNEMTSLSLPNGKSYNFYYNTNPHGGGDPYGMISEIDYPTGGYVRYVWGVNSHSEAGQDNSTYNGSDYSCAYYYDTPVVTDRYVSFDGSTEVLHQHFAYSPTTWETGGNAGLYSQKKTIVTTYDLVRGGNFQTVYTYSGVPVQFQPDTTDAYTNQMPVESQIQYYDWASNGGGLLKTVNKTYEGFQGQNEMLCESATLGSLTSRTDYAYGTPMALVTDKKEWDWGTAPPCGSSDSGTPLRETVTNYNTFTTPIYPGGASIFDKPSQVTVYGSGTQIAQTTYAYTDTVSSAGVTVGRDSNYNGNSGIARGNASSITRWLNGGSSPVTTYNYDDTGQVTSMIDPCGNTSCGDMTGSNHTTSYSYSNYNAYVSTITYPNTGVAHAESFTYNPSTGEVASSTDENGKITSYTYNDPFARLTETDYPDGGKTTLSYNDTAPTPSVTTTKEMNPSQSIVSTAISNGMGMPTETELTSDPQGTDYTVTGYDGLGRTYTVTNPYRSTSDPTYGTTTYVYDGLGRTTSVTKPDGGVVSTVYSSNCTTVTDEAGKNRESCTDGLGRMTQVIENPGGLGYTTNYTYDGLDDLTSVVQGGSRNRSFTFDSLKRMTQSNNPESSTINYTYDANGNVSTKTDARSITTTYAYDALNRVTGMTYSNSDPSVSYTYDQSACLGQSACYNIGHRTTMTDAGGSEEFAYDTMGREIAEQRTTNSITKSTSYAYDLAGDMTSLVYPSGRTITYAYDSAGRPSEAQDVPNNINYAIGSCANGLSSSGVCYAPNGSVAQMQNGSNLVSTYIYNTRFQPCWMYATTGTALPTNTTCTSSDPGPGNILDLQYNFNLGAGDNGNVVGITNKRDTTRTENFTYDALNRIVTAKTSSTSGSHCWGQTYTIDQWANLTNIGYISGYTGCSQGTFSVLATANNQLAATGYVYDLSGNMLNDASNQYTFNAESEITSAQGVNYTYDGDGNRVEKSGARLYWYGAGAEILDETDLRGNVQLEFVYFGGRRVAHRIPSSGNIYYYEEDMLGSSRTIVQAGQTSPCFDADFLPFGGERDITSTCSQNYNFEGKKRDPETGNDDFGARYYASRLSRWLSPDWSAIPAPVPYANLTNPQTLNLYAMVSDNPETFADLDGHVSSDGGPYNLETADFSEGGPAAGNCDYMGGDCSQKLFDDENSGIPSWYLSEVSNSAAAQQQKYDPSKTGPEDPTNPGKPLFQNAVVKKASNDAFMSTTNGQAREGLAESGFAIDYKDGKLSVVNKVSSVNSDQKPNELHIKIDPNTIAILHTHGNNAIPTPSPGDTRSPVPNFVRSQRALYVTIPGTNKYIRLQP